METQEKYHGKDDKKLRSFIIVTLIFAVLSISVAFAALSQTLIINIDGKIRGSEWSLIWSAASGSKTGTSSSSSSYGISSGVGSPTLTISGIVLEQPGDKVEWIVTASNEGVIDAVLANFTELFTKTVTFNPSEASNLDANDILVTLTKSPSGAVTIGDELDAGDTQDYILTIEFRPGATEVPSHDVTITVTALFPWIQK